LRSRASLVAGSQAELGNQVEMALSGKLKSFLLRAQSSQPICLTLLTSRLTNSTDRFTYNQFFKTL
jgi:hypothetical protein